MNDKQACAADPMAFGRRYLGHYFTLSSPAFHRQLGRLWQKRVMKGMTPGEDTLPTMLAAPGCRLALAAPRGHAKSTVMSLQNVLHAALYGYPRALTTEELALFIRIEYERVGADLNITPREVIRDFIELLDLLYQHPAVRVAELLASDEFSYAKSEAVADDADANYAEFTL